MTPRAPATPAVLRWARENAGYTLEDVQWRGITPAHVQAWEAGSSSPTLAQLTELGYRYGQTAAFFFLSTPPAKGLALPTDFRDHAEGRVSPQLRKEIRLAAKRQVLMLELSPATKNGLKGLPDPHTDITAAADAARNRLGVTWDRQSSFSDAREAFNSWSKAIQALGVAVFHMSRISQDECRGFSQYNSQLPTIVLNGRDRPQARSFTLMHELGHLISRSDGMCTLWRDNRSEYLCNAFAAEVLMPADHFLSQIDDRDPVSCIEPLATRFRVSQEAVAVRMRVLGKISQTELTTIRQRIAHYVSDQRVESTDTSTGPPHHLVHLRNIGAQFADTVLSALYSDRISISDATYYLDAKVETIERIEAELGKHRTST